MEILEAIRQEYGQQIFPCWQLSAILKDCGYTEKEISEVIRESINQRKVGVVTFRKLRRRPPSQSLIVFI